MANDFKDGLLLFEGGREVRIVAHNVSQTNALVHADGLDIRQCIMLDQSR
jgi:hypothetical protein